MLTEIAMLEIQRIAKIYF